jgi:predicted ATPase/DNA-binding SARP family transcriptional activator
MRPSAELEFRILGPLEVRAGGVRLRLGGSRQRAVLAVLLVSANEPVSTDRLMNALWGEHPPGTAKTALQGYITQLRRMLEPGRKKRAAGEVLVTTPAGYVLRVADGVLDRDCFERLVGEGREALAAGQATSAAELFRSALALWRGPVLADFAYDAWAHAEAERLEELQLACLEDRIESDLRLGHDAELVPELETIVADHPLRERARAQLMLALYRAGRQAEALDLYQQTRQLLVEELGIDPSAELRELERAILRQDERLAAPPARSLPEGTVTLLATDIEGSTRLVHELGAEEYAEALHEHRRLLRAAFADHGGVEVDAEGDAFLVSFPTAPAAVQAAEAATNSLGSGPIRVRIGIHTGAPLVTGEGYVGVDVHRVARVAAAGHGGQVIVSEATARLIEAPSLSDLGDHRLKDLTAPTRLYQLGDEQFPPLNTLHQTNLPVQPTPLVGRESELEAVLELLTDSRLVTLTGAGGSGKTRLALQAAAELVEEHTDGVWWVSLAALRDHELVMPTIAQIIGAKDTLVEHLRARRTLLLLDNFEHLLEAAPRIAELLGQSTGVRVLATSRERLGVAAEQEYPVPTLAPAEAVALFFAKARQLEPNFESNGAVHEICRRLDGLPLAIELAAARIKVLHPDQILDRLGRGLDLLTTGSRDAPERQHTLRATIQWSHDLLSSEERKLFPRLSVFPGSFRLEAAEAICGAELDRLAALVDKNLLRRTNEGRFFLLETISEYAQERLQETGEADQLLRRHAEFYLLLVEPLKYELRAMDSTVIALVDAESDNLRSAMSWAIDHGDAELAERLLCSVWFHWFVRGRTAEGDQLAGRVVALAGPTPTPMSAEALSLAAEFARFRGDLDRAATLKEATLAALRVLPRDAESWTPTLTDLAQIEARRGNLERARSLAEEALALRIDEERRGEGFRGGIEHARYAIVNIEFRERNFEIAERTLEEIVQAERSDHHMADIAEELAALAQVKRSLGKRAEAVAALREGVTHAWDQRHEPSLCECLEVSAYLAFDAGRPMHSATLWGAAERLRSTSGFGDFFHASEHDRLIGVAKAELGDAVFSSALREGRSLEAPDAVDYALRSLD